MASDENIIMLGEAFAGIMAKVRTKATGTQRVTLEVKADVVVANMDPVALGKPVADAWNEAIMQSVLNETEIADQDTRAAREKDQKAYDAGKAWALKKYSAPRLGSFRPGGRTAVRSLVNSGLLARSIRTMYVESVGAYITNVTAKRLNYDTVRARTWPKLQRAIARAAESPLINEGVAKALGVSIQKVQDARREHLTKIFNEARNAMQAARALGGELEQLSEAPEE